jgi:hypothetical protein
LENELVSYKSAVSINRSAAQIFPYLLEAAAHSSQENLRNGSLVDVEFGIGIVKMMVGIQISALEVGQRLAFRAYSGPIKWEGQYDLKEDGAGSTTVSQKGQLKFKGLWRLWQPIAGGQIKRGEVAELVRLKERVEATPAIA